MAIVAPVKFDEFSDGGRLKVGDIVVGLRGGKNFQFEFPSDGINDANDNALFTYTGNGALAKNHINLHNAVSGDPALIKSLGQDVNIDIKFIPKGTGIMDVPTPTQPKSAATKEYVDSTALAERKYEAARVSSVGNYSATYDNGASGVGATLTATFNGIATIDGIALNVGDITVFAEQTNTFENGVYLLTTNGTGGTPSIFTRSTAFDRPLEIPQGQGVGVAEGAVKHGTLCVQTELVVTMGVSPILFEVSSIQSTTVPVDNSIVRYNGVTGKLIQDSVAILDDLGEISGLTKANIDNVQIDGNQIKTTNPNGSLDVDLDGSGIFTVNASAAGFDNILDEDNMASDSATAAATQQSIKAYVDAINIGTIPQYRVGLAVDQTLTTAVITKIELDTVIFDTNSDYDNTVNYRFTVTVPGKYLIIAALRYGSISANDPGSVFIYKNGSSNAENTIWTAGSSRDLYPQAVVLVDMSATDYIEIYGLHTSGSDRDILTGEATYVCGFKVASL